MHKLSKLIMAAGVLSSSAALATPYQTLRSIGGTCNLFQADNLGTATAPYKDRGDYDRVYVNGELVDSDGLPGPSGMIADDTPQRHDRYVGIAPAIVLNVPEPDYVTASTQVHDARYWVNQQTNEDPTTPTAPLDALGSLADIANASTRMPAPGAVSSTAPEGGILKAALVGEGLTVIDLPPSEDAVISGIQIAKNNDAGSGLVISVPGDRLTFTDKASDLGPLKSSQVLIHFGGALVMPIRALAFRSADLAPLASVNLLDGQVPVALVMTRYGTVSRSGIDAFADPIPTLVQFTGDIGAIAKTPEPPSLLLFAAGLAAIGLLAGRRRQVQP